MATTTTQAKAITPAKLEAALTKMDAGVQANLPAGVSLTINGTAQKEAVIDQTLQNWITIFKAVDTAKQAYQDAVKARLAITVAAQTYLKGLKAVIKQYFGAEASVLTSFGITADKPKSTAATTKVVAAAKAAQTKVVRGTKSKKAAAAITVVGNPPVSIASDGKVQSGPPTINTGSGTPSSTSSSTQSSSPASTAAPAAPSTTPSSGGSTPAGA